jgi:hypothetical protein
MAIVITFSMWMIVSRIIVISIIITKARRLLIVFGVRSLEGFVKLVIFIVVIMGIMIV